MKKYRVTDGNGDAEIKANSAKEAAQNFVNDGGWGEIVQTIWINVNVTPIIPQPNEKEIRELVGNDREIDMEWDDSKILVIPSPIGSEEENTIPFTDSEITKIKEKYPNSFLDSGNCLIIDFDNVREFEENFTITLDPEEPECDENEHIWESPFSVVGGIKENPGVWGNGGGVIIKQVCSCCGIYKITDTWAQNWETGEQGLTSTKYEDADNDSLEWVKQLERVEHEI